LISPTEADEDLDLEDEEDEFADYPLDNPILGAQELLRFARVKRCFWLEDAAPFPQVTVSPDGYV